MRGLRRTRVSLLRHRARSWERSREEHGENAGRGRVHGHRDLCGRHGCGRHVRHDHRGHGVRPEKQARGRHRQWERSRSKQAVRLLRRYRRSRPRCRPERRSEQPLTASPGWRSVSSRRAGHGHDGVHGDHASGGCHLHREHLRQFRSHRWSALERPGRQRKWGHRSPPRHCLQVECFRCRAGVRGCRCDRDGRDGLDHHGHGHVHGRCAHRNDCRNPLSRRRSCLLMWALRGCHDRAGQHGRRCPRYRSRRSRPPLP